MNSESEELDYDRLIEKNKVLLGVEKLPPQMINELNSSYNITVADCIGQCILLASDLAFKFKDDVARNYMLHAIVVRLKLIHEAFRQMISVANPLRPQPLSLDESFSVCRDLNLIYLNLRGVLDNLAYCFLCEKNTDRASKRKLQK